MKENLSQIHPHSISQASTLVQTLLGELSISDFLNQKPF